MNSAVFGKNTYSDPYEVLYPVKRLGVPGNVGIERIPGIARLCLWYGNNFW